MQRFAQKLLTFARFGDDLARLSTCKRAQTGCVIFDPNCTRVLAIGYNGPPSKQPHSLCTGEEGVCGCVHAEANALIKLASTEQCLLYTTMSPCVMCASLIVNSSVRGILFKEPYRLRAGLDLLAAAGIVHVDVKRIKLGIDRDLNDILVNMCSS